MTEITYISLFSGIGGFELGLDNSKHNFKCLGYSEIDKYAKSIYQKHYPDHLDLGDATKIRTEDLPDFDFLVGGFPCQAFSIAGERRGFDDTRGTLFFEIARILTDKRPRYFLLENVRGLLSHDKGKTFKTILEILSDIGYYVKWEVFNSKDYGVPQNRERVFIKGYSRTECGGEVLSFRTNDEKYSKGELIKEHRDTLQLNTKHKTYQDGRIYSHNGLSIALNARGNNGWYTTNNEEEQEIKEKYSRKKETDVIKKNFSKVDENRMMTTTKTGDSYALTCTRPTRPLSKKLTNYVLEKNFTDVDENRKVATTKDGNCFAVNTRPRFRPLSKKLDSYVLEECIGSTQKHAARTDGSETPTLTAAMGCGGGHVPMLKFKNEEKNVTQKYRIRRLTPVECERLQAFPDNWTALGKDNEEISNTQRYKCIGNAVTTTVITFIANEMFDHERS